MTRERLPWAQADRITGPCVICGKEVVYVVPRRRPDPAFLFHSTCDITQKMWKALGAIPDPTPSSQKPT